MAEAGDETDGSGGEGEEGEEEEEERRALELPPRSARRGSKAGQQATECVNPSAQFAVSFQGSTPFFDPSSMPTFTGAGDGCTAAAL